jgi:CelD/BcsL family acetyltransferase involved in cellulose biosynthesis
MALSLRPIVADARAWERMDALPDRVLFQTRAWMDFLGATQGAEPVVAAVVDDGEDVGCFTGAIIRRFGIRILGSPFPGWTTESMGFTLRDGVDRDAAAAALIPFAFRTLGCAHVEIKDRRLVPDDPGALGYAAEPTLTFEVDLARDEAAILQGMSSACRRAIRRGVKVGVTVEQAGGTGFAAEYHAQLVEVFARQSLVPTYGVDRVRALISCLEPTGRVLLLRARAPDGRPIATGIFPAYNGTAYFWGGASLREYQILRPNEAIFWAAIQYWRARGMTCLDLGGGGDYKRKYGPTEVRVPHLRASRFAGLSALRGLARLATEQANALRGRARRRQDVPPTRTLCVSQSRSSRARSRSVSTCVCSSVVARM